MNQDLNLFNFHRTIPAPAEQIYRCFTTAPGFQEWLCNSAYLAAKPGGFLTLSWRSGYYAIGEYIRMEPNKEILFSWHGRGEPQSTQVQVLLSSQGDGTLVELIHSCLGSEEIWAEARKSIASGWEKSLQNLESVLTTGIDLRVVNRPSIGIYPLELNPELAAISNLPVTRGIYLNDVIPGRSADLAGLAKGDVIVAVDGEPVGDLQSFIRILQTCHPGDRMQISYYRGGSARETVLNLLPFPIPDIPINPGELAAAVRSSYEEINQALHACVDKITNETASRKTMTGWNAKETLAHLIHVERDLHLAIQAALTNQVFNWLDNTEARIKACLAVFLSCHELMQELERAQAETVAFIKSLPDDFAARKSSMWRLGYMVLTMKYHTQEHILQIEEAIRP